MEALWFLVGIHLGIGTAVMVICAVQISRINARHRRKHEHDSVTENN